MPSPTLQAISPFFIVSNVDRTIAFYRDVLGFEVRLQEPDRNPFFAIIGRDGAQLSSKPKQEYLRSRIPAVIRTYAGTPLSPQPTLMLSL